MISKIDVGGLFVAIGSIPNTQLIKDVIKLNKMGFIITDENMQTNVKGVYAAGDIRDKPLKQVITAAADGAITAYMVERYIDEYSW